MRRDTLIKLMISVIILALLFSVVNTRDFMESILKIRPVFFLALLLLPLSILIRAWRWKMLMEHGGCPVSCGDAYGLTLVGVALNMLLPGGMGDIAKSYYGYRWHGLREEMLSTSVLDKVIALLSIFILGTAAAFWSGMLWGSVSLLLSLISVFMVFCPDVFPWRRIMNLMGLISKRRLDPDKLFTFYTSSGNLKLRAMILSFIGWLVSYLQFYIVCLSFGVNVDIAYILAISPLVNLALVFPLTMNGLGSSDAVVVYFLGLKGVALSTALIISLFYSQILTTLIPGIFGLILILRR